MCVIAIMMTVKRATLQIQQYVLSAMVAIIQLHLPLAVAGKKRKYEREKITMLMCYEVYDVVPPGNSGIVSGWY